MYNLSRIIELMLIEFTATLIIIDMLISKLGRIVRPTYAFSQIKLHEPHFKRYFDSNISNIDKEIKEVAKKYSLNKEGIEKLFRLNPQVFIPGSLQRTEMQNKIILLNELEKTQPLAAILNELLFESNHLMTDMSSQKIVEFIKTVKELGIDEKSAKGLFQSSKNIIHNNFDLLYKQKLAILVDYLQLTPTQALRIFVQEPFLLNCSSQRLRESVCYFVERKNHVLTRQRIVDLLTNLGQIFLMGREQLNMLIQWYRRWGIQKQQLWTILLQHPLLLLNHPAEVFHFKAKMLRQFKFTDQMAQDLLRKYPSVLICSVRSLESKFLAARDRLKISINANNLEYLTFKFMANIRPRSEMLIRAKVPYTSEDIVEYLKCSQKQFLAKTGVPAEKYFEQKNKYLITPELDFVNKKCLKGYASDKKIFQYSIGYYQKEDLILKQA